MPGLQRVILADLAAIATLDNAAARDHSSSAVVQAHACVGGCEGQTEVHPSNSNPVSSDDRMPELEIDDDDDADLSLPWWPVSATHDNDEDSVDDGQDLNLPWWPVPSTPVATPTTTPATTPREGNATQQQPSTTSNEVQTYHSRAVLDNGHEAVLIDTGAWDNLTGDAWVRRIVALLASKGLRPKYEMLKNIMKVKGVGKHHQEVQEAVVMPGGLEGGHPTTYTTPVVPESDIPALLGLRSLETLRGTIDTRREQRKLYIGDVEIKPCAGTKVLQLYPARSGHLMLPITHLEHLNKQHIALIASKDETPASSSKDHNAAPSKQ